MATLTVTLAQLQEISKLRVSGVDMYTGPVLFEAAPNVSRAIFVQDRRGHIFVLTPQPTQAAFLDAFPGALKVGNIAT